MRLKRSLKVSAGLGVLALVAALAPADAAFAGNSTLTVVVTDSISGLPVTSACVSAADYATNDSGSTCDDSVTPGTYVINGLSASPHEVRVTGLGYVPTFGGGVTDINAETYVTPPASVSIALVVGGTLAGRLIDSSAHPIAGASVNVLGQNGESGFATTDSDGNWSITSLPAIAYPVSFTLPDGSQQWAHQKATQDAADPVTVVARQTVTVDETFLDANRFGHLTGTIRDARTQLPVAGACVLSKLIPDPLDNGYGQGCTDALGHYDIAARGGNYQLEAVDFTGALLPTWYGQSPTQSGPKTKTVALAPNSTLTGLNVSLGAAGHITGVVVDSKTHQPLADTVIRLHLGRDVQGVEPYGTTYTDSTGTFDVGGLRSGSYTLETTSYDGLHAPQWYSGEGSQASATLIPVTVGKTTAIGALSTRVGGTIKGLVTDRVTHAPVANVCVGVGVFNFRSGSDDSGFGTACTDSSGLFALSGLPAGSYHVEYVPSYDGHAPTWYQSVHRTTSTAVVVGWAKSTTANQALVMGATVTGTITGLAAPDQVLIDAYDPVTGDIVARGSESPDGTWSVAGVPAGGTKVAADDYNPSVLWWPNATSFGAGAVISTKVGQTHSGINFTFAP